MMGQKPFGFLRDVVAALLFAMAAHAAPIGATDVQYETSDIIFGVICMITGLLMLTFGYRLFKIVMFLAGFYFGYWLCYIIMTNVNDNYGEYEEWIIFGSCFGAGLLMGLLLVCIFYLGIFILGALAGFFLAVWILTFVPPEAPIQETVYRWLFIGGLGLVVAILAVFMQKPLIIIGSSFAGSYVLFYGIDVFAETGFKDAIQKVLQGEPVGELSDPLLAMLICSLVAAILGILIQLRTGKNYDHTQGKTAEDRSLYVQINSS